MRRLVAMAAASAVLALSACGPEVENVQKWMLGGKSTWNNMGAPVERSSGTTLSVAEDGTGVAWSLASPARNLHDIYIEPKSEDEFRVLPDYEAFDRRGYTFEHMLKEGEAWRIRRVRDDCGPFRGDTIDLETGEPNGSGGEWWPGTVCVAEVTDPEHCEPPGGPVNCYQYVWCSGTPPPAQACQDRWEEEGTLDPR